MIDVEKVRTDTPAVQDVVHFNSCGSSLPPASVLAATIDYLETEARMGGYEAGAERLDDLDEVYRATARYLNCSESEVAFTAGASDAWWRAFASVPLSAGDRVLISHSEFQANAYGFLQARERGVEIDVVRNDSEGTVDLEALEGMIDGRVKLISLTHISMANGAVHQAREVGKIARQAGVLFLLDSCQAAGQRPLDVQDLQCDFLCYTGRKFMRGMRGTGILFCRSDAIERLGPSPFVDGRSATWTSADTYQLADGARRFEFGEQNFAGKVGLGVATNYALDIGLEAIEARIGYLADSLRTALREVPGITIQDQGLDQCGIVTFTSDRLEPSSIQQQLSRRRINVGAPGRANAQLDLGTRGLDSIVRAGVHYFNTADEIEKMVNAVAEIVKA